MNNEVTIPVIKSPAARKTGSFVLMFVVSVIAGTALRASLLFIYPLIVLLITAYYRFRISASMIIMFALAGSVFLLSLYPNLFLKYKLVSLYYVLPFMFFFFAKPGKERNVDHLRIFISCLTAVAIINDVIGIFQVIRNPASDDSFLGLYSQYSISLNGLMLINTILFVFYFLQFLRSRRFVFVAAFTFFGVSAMLGFYGAGVIVCGIAFILTFFRFTIRSIVTTFVVALLTFIGAYFTLRAIKPLVLQYNIENIQKIVRMDLQTGPRKLISFYNYAISYPANLKDFLFGSGPGTFVSRSAFMVGSPSYFQALPIIKDDQQPYYFKNYAYTLWNERNTIKELYLDGFRNQPFSTILAFLGEYGLIFTVIFFLLYIAYFTEVRKLFISGKSSASVIASFRFFKYLIILTPLLFLIDNYIEHPEVMLLILIGIKFAHADLQEKNRQLHSHESHEQLA